MCNEIMFRKKVIIVFCSKIIIGATKINLCKTIFSNSENFVGTRISRMVD